MIYLECWYQVPEILDASDEMQCGSTKGFMKGSDVQIYERSVANVANYNHGNMPSSNSSMDSVLRVPQLRVPRVVHATRSLEARCKRSYDANAHLYFINSVSASPDQGTFISADDLCIHLWNLEHDDGNQIILDMRPLDQDYTAVCLFCICMIYHASSAFA